MRLFVAVDIDEAVRKGLAKLQEELQGHVDIRKSDVKWIRPELIHLTLKFLGEVKDGKIAEVCDIVGKAAAEHEGFDLDVVKVGCFGGISARVLWAGIGQENEHLQRLQEDIEGALAKSDWPAENRKFTGHLTLCRIRNSKAGIKLAQLAKNYEDLQLGSVLIDSVCVYQSQLTSQGPVYTVLSRTALR